MTDKQLLPETIWICPTGEQTWSIEGENVTPELQYVRKDTVTPPSAQAGDAEFIAAQKRLAECVVLPGDADLEEVIYNGFWDDLRTVTALSRMGGEPFERIEDGKCANCGGNGSRWLKHGIECCFVCKPVATHPAQEIEGQGKIDAQIQAIKNWMSENAPYIDKDQKHLDENTEARAYWHYGRLVALKDVLAYLRQRGAK